MRDEKVQEAFKAFRDVMDRERAQTSQPRGAVCETLEAVIVELDRLEACRKTDASVIHQINQRVRNIEYALLSDRRGRPLPPAPNIIYADFRARLRVAPSGERGGRTCGECAWVATGIEPSPRCRENPHWPVVDPRDPACPKFK